jgi:methanogenic corrinoid protein MtbC1
MKVVVHETGLKPDTLRAWERRYGVPNPERTPGGHRLYSQHEIDLLKWLVARQDEGMSISHAVELWQQLESEGQNPLLTMETAVAEPTLPNVTGEQVDELREAWVEACLAFDEYRAQHLLARAFALFSIETVCYQVLQQGLNKIGEGWYEGAVSVQQEHFASALALRQLEALLVAMPAPTRHGRILVACPPTELHTFAPLMISLMLRRQGWDVVYLGANVPLDRLEASVEQIKPQLVILSAQTLTAAGHMLPLAQKLAEMDVPLAFGGAVFNQIEQTVEAIPGHFLTKTLEQVPQTVEKLMQTRPAIGTVKKFSKAYQDAYDHFIERRSAIDAHLHVTPRLLEMPTALLNDTNNELSNNIEAALRLGDMAMVEANLDWVTGLLLNNHARLTEVALQHYLQQYHEAVKTVMDDKRAAPLLDWFAQLN